jgi:uncharacterized protein YjbI with pentapeptide repeats
LQAYLTEIAQLMLDKGRSLGKPEQDDADARTVARALKLTVLSKVDGIRKRSVLEFLYESGLISVERPVLNLIRADLRGASLNAINLKEADLTWANLEKANLYGAFLEGAFLKGADLQRADLRRCILDQADLGQATYLGVSRNTRLKGAKLSGASLSGANLFRVYGVTNEKLERQASHLDGAIMPNGQKYEKWLKSKGRGEHGG